MKDSSLLAFLALLSNYEYFRIQQEDKPPFYSTGIDRSCGWVLRFDRKFATPVYFYSLPAQLKMLIDRFFAREYEIREAKKRKQAYLILTAGTNDQSQTIGIVESFRGFIKVLRTVDEGGIIYGLNLLSKGQAKDSPFYQEAYEMAKSLKDS